jgi:hypothetical protein
MVSTAMPQAKKIQPSGDASTPVEIRLMGASGTNAGTRFGSSDDYVRAIQRKVGASVDGRWGPGTTNAILAKNRLYAMSGTYLPGRYVNALQQSLSTKALTDDALIGAYLVAYHDELQRAGVYPADQVWFVLQQGAPAVSFENAAISLESGSGAVAFATPGSSPGGAGAGAGASGTRSGGGAAGGGASALGGAAATVATTSAMSTALPIFGVVAAVGLVALGVAVFVGDEPESDKKSPPPPPVLPALKQAAKATGAQAKAQAKRLAAKAQSGGKKIQERVAAANAAYWRTAQQQAKKK